MSKAKIWLIVSVMSVALLGITGMQVTWIQNLIRLNGENFDEQVFAALNSAADRLTQLENRDAYANGYSIDFFENRNFGGAEEALDSSAAEVPGDFANFRSGGRRPQYSASSFRQYMQYTFDLQNVPLGSRIQPALLDTLLQQELGGYGITAKYTYGVFSVELVDFIIVDGAYYMNDKGPVNFVSDDSAEQGSLETSKYAVWLFKDASPQPPGMLVIHFPDRSSILLASVWWTILVSGLLLSLVLACFAYSIFIIFRQKRVSRMKNDFISNMTHEFKTPIATISLAADSITNAKVISSPDKLMRFAGIIKAENQRMHRQVEKVLQAAQIERGEMKLKPVELDINELAREAAEHMMLQVEQRGGQLHLDIRAEHPVVTADRTHLSNVVHNLIDNAIKYSPDVVDITVGTEDARGGVRVRVRDRGIGMTAEDQRQIFESFFRVHTGNRHDVKGFGLGLSYVKATIEAHGGQVSVQSVPHQGSTFTIQLPQKPASSKSQQYVDT